MALVWGRERKKIPVTPVTDQLFDDLVKWRQRLTRSISSSTKNMSILKNDSQNLDESVQKILDRLIFIRVAEDKGLEAKTLRAQWRDWKLVRAGRPFYHLLDELFSQFDKNYDSNLFTHNLCDDLSIDDVTLNRIVEELYENTEGFEYNFADIDADVLGSIYENYLGFMLKKFKKRTTVVESYTQRKKMGSYYTPTYIVDFIIRSTIGSIEREISDTPITVLDMACGSGSFLIKALSFLERRNKTVGLEQKTALLGNSIFGVDIDPKAVQLAHLNLLVQLLEKRAILPLLTRNIKLGNSLISDPKVDDKALDWHESFESVMTSGGFDVIVGNPPYLDSEEMTRSQPKLREYYSDSDVYKSAHGNWDIFCLFLERGLQLVRPGDYVGMIVPNKLLSADYASSIRKLIQQYKILTIRDYSTVHVFNAAVYPIVIIVKKEAPDNNIISLEVAKQDEVGSINVQKTNEFDQRELPKLVTWSPLFSKTENALGEKIFSQSKPLQELAQVDGAATVSEAYETIKIVKELTNHQYYFKIINTGTIDRYGSLWGIQNTRISGSYAKPIVKVDDLKELLPKRAGQAKSAKIIIGGMNKRLECFFDKHGAYLAGKTTVIITEPKLPFEVLLGILNSKLLSFCYKNMFQALSLSGGFMRIGPPQIRLLPIKTPSADQAERLTELVGELIGLNKKLGDVGEESDRGAALKEQISSKDRQLDELVYRIYDLSIDEIQVVENSILS
jgi:adenine-specific DNA-methyltransferase